MNYFNTAGNLRHSNAAAAGPKPGRCRREKETHKEETKMETFVICIAAMAAGYVVRVAQEIEVISK